MKARRLIGAGMTACYLHIGRRGGLKTHVVENRFYNEELRKKLKSDLFFYH